MTVTTEHSDASFSYADEEGVAARPLVEALHAGGVDVFDDTWSFGPDDVLVHRLDAGLRHRRNGALVVSPVDGATVGDARVRARSRRAIDLTHTNSRSRGQ